MKRFTFLSFLFLSLPFLVERLGIVDVDRDLVGVEGRIVVIVDGDSAWRRGEAGESGRRKGEVRGEPKERGEGL